MNFSTDHPRFLELIDAMAQLAAGRDDIQLPVNDSSDGWDGLSAGLNMLAEELNHQRMLRAKTEALLGDVIELYEHSPVWFCSADVTTLQVVACNATMRSELGLTREALLDLKLSKLFSESQYQTLQQLLRQVKNGDVPVSGQLRVQALDGQLRDMVLDVSVAKDPSGAPIRYRLAMRDHTRISELQRQINAAQKMDAVGQLAAGIAHDFNNLLTVILGSADMLRPEIAGRLDAQESLDELVNAANTASDLTRRLVAFGGRSVAYAEELSCVAAIERATGMLLRLVPENIRVEVLTAPRLWDVEMVPGDLEQVIVNLALNAQAAMPSGGRLTIEARNQRDPALEEVVHICVRDTGRGMSASVVARAFEPFFSTKPGTAGAGLGLATCYGIVERAKGRMDIESRPGEGTTIHILIPRVASTKQETKSDPAVEVEATRILIVEDEIGVRKIASRFLERQGFTVSQAATAEAALKLLDAGARVDAIVTDVVMPGMGGIELAKRVRERDATARLLMVSGYSPDPLEALLTDPLIDFLAKPYTPSQLTARLSQLLSAAPDGSPAS